ncbi:WYL domain-containing protein [Paramuribaculum intestinale]|uniref:WYL domain-containing protein n=1 Tax=Paramuribaculum intestinale TaxID=2094151 RepID=UPI0025AA1D86|nr:WYL domain-containing protein [Paramuribaculum intestinale]
MEYEDVTLDCKRLVGRQVKIRNAVAFFKSYVAKSWLLSAFAVNNVLNGNRALQGRVIYEDIPSGEKFLQPILDAMRQNREIDLLYTPFYRSAPKLHQVQPYAVKVNQRRWYLLARNSNGDKLFHLALDRMAKVEVADRYFEIDPAFDIDAYYDAAFGVITGMEEEYDIEKVRIRVYNDYHRADYLRTLPLHRSQIVIDSTPAYTIFEYRLRPTDDFLSAILALGADAEVLSPEWYRKYAIKEVKRILSRYKNV